MLTMPTLTTDRLHLRPLFNSDALTIQLLVNDPRIARHLPLPHPYPDGLAEHFIQRSRAKAATDDGFSLAIIHTESADLIGTVSCRTALPQSRATIRFWIGVRYWGKNYAAEAAAALLDHLFTTLNLHRIEAAHSAHNPAAGRVLQKLHLTHEGTFRDEFKTDQGYADAHHYALLRPHYLAQQRMHCILASATEPQA